ncbi:hypothetical protein [Flagellimonas pacifica]|nr:hypothetical protein [Allomuricauda parva]
MKKTVFLFFCFATYLGYAQSDASSGNIAGLNSGSNTQASGLILASSLSSTRPNAARPSFDNITGSAYISDSFQPSKLYYGDEFMKNIFYRYNAYNEEIEIKESPTIATQNVSSLNKDKKIAIMVNNRRMSFKTFVTSEKKTLNGYLTQLSDGNKYDLYKRTHIIFSPGRVSTNSFVKAVPSRFTKFTEYYFQKDGVNRIDEITTNNRTFLKLLDSPVRSKIKAFLKENKLSVKKEADLHKIFVELNNN